MLKQALLKRIHADHDLENGVSRYSLTFWSKQETAKIVESLAPGKLESLRVKSGGHIMSGNTRTKVLEERASDINIQVWLIWLENKILAINLARSFYAQILSDLTF